jgi:two-component sensor histidine kinase
MFENDHTISVHIESEIETLPLKTMVQLGIMVTEMLTNSVKYAFNGQVGKIHISLKKEEDNLLFEYSDDGIGDSDPKQLIKRKSLGMKLIRLTAKQLRGSLDISSSRGLHYQIRFKR